MSSLNINSLYETMYERNLKRYQKFDDILKKLHNRIRYHAKNEKTFCFFQIPVTIYYRHTIFFIPLKIFFNYIILKDNKTYTIYASSIIGVPLYNIDDLKEYLIKSLQKDGFEYMYIDPNWLFVTWELKKSKKIPSPKPKKKKDQGQYKLIDEYKPSGSLYNEYDMSNMRQKMNDLL